MQAQRPVLVEPVDLQPALDRLHGAYKEGLISAQDIQKRLTVGNTEAEAQRKENEARAAKAEQERKEQEGGKGYTKPGLFSRLTGIGTGPKRAVAPAPAIPAPAATAPTSSPYLEAASAEDFNPAHESTDDLLRLVQEGGFFAQ